MNDSHTSSLSVAQAQLPSLIWQAGREMESMKLQTGAHIQPTSITLLAILNTSLFSGRFLHRVLHFPTAPDSTVKHD
ncbi:hypothetical protein JMJ35_000365 [Cladonia borealis]|uniref:Uncharacterized protein n=1 Tax=Cladonia borealis TaxID=184061 RepID=A0AA39R996_9LECA|nr:hypothetical protein JMJ35_000365 [Cladonia borealis]